MIVEGLFGGPARGKDHRVLDALMYRGKRRRKSLSRVLRYLGS
jgi:hypothetical protein